MSFCCSMYFSYAVQDFDFKTDILISQDFCNKLPQIFQLKTIENDYLTVLGQKYKSKVSLCLIPLESLRICFKLSSQFLVAAINHQHPWLEATFLQSLCLTACRSLSVSSLYISNLSTISVRRSIIGFRTCFKYKMLLMYLHLQSPYIQIRPHSQIPEQDLDKSFRKHN